MSSDRFVDDGDFSECCRQIFVECIWESCRGYFWLVLHCLYFISFSLFAVVRKCLL